MLKKALLGGAIALMAVATPAAAQNVLKFQGAATAGDFVQTVYEDWAAKFNAMTPDDGLKIEVLPFQAVVPYKETLEATSAGLLAGDMQAVSYFAGRDQAFSILGDLIAGYDKPEQTWAFCQHGGGKEMLQEAYDSIMPGKLHVVGCGSFTREALVSSIPINGVEDLKGVRIRSPEGLATAVFERAGAAPVPLPYSEVFSSLEKGVIDAADASSYANNSVTGAHSVAKYPLYPGIHSMAILQLVIGKAQWDRLSSAEQAMIEMWYGAMHHDLTHRAEIEDKRLVAEDLAKGDVTIINWPQAERDALREIAVEAWEATAKESELAAKALNAHYDFMKRIGLRN